jgi:hypothetical protein
LFGSRFACAQTAIFFASFSPNRVPKMRERYQLFFGLRLVSKESHHSAIQTKIELHLGGFFHQAKVRQTGFYADRDPNKQEVAVIFA